MENKNKRKKLLKPKAGCLIKQIKLINLYLDYLRKGERERKDKEDTTC